MKENISIAILLIITTIAYSVIVITVFDKTRGPEDAGGVVAAAERTAVSTDLTVIKEAYPKAKKEYEPEAEAEMIPVPTPTPRPEISTAGMTSSVLWEEEVDDYEPFDEEEEEPTPTPVDLIIDMDYNSDVDDTAALRIAAMLDRFGRVDLKAAMASTGGEDVCRAIHAQLSYDGCGDVPVGMAAQDVPGGSPYWDDLIQHYFTAADYRLYNSVELYKSVLRDLDKVEKEKEKERKRLREKFDYEDEDMPEELKCVEKLRIVTTGYLVNVAGLLQDAEGYSLVCQYVDSIWVTGGVYLQGEDHNFICTKECADAARYVLAACPVTLIFSSSASIFNDDGSSIFCGSSILAMDTAGTDPVAMAFRDYSKANKEPITGGRFAWDPFCLWVACVPMEESFTYLEPIQLSIYENGRNRFSYDLPPNCHIIRRCSEDLSWYAGQIDLLIDAGLR